MKLILLFLAIFISPAGAQSPGAPFLLPHTIFVGDPGLLVVPLGQGFAELEPFIWDNLEGLTETPDLLIRRIELERRGGVTRLLIDFIPYAPGRLPIPPLERFFPGPGSFAAAFPDLLFPPLEVHISSILRPYQTILSEPAPPLAVPGTSLLIYGSIILIILILFLVIAGSIWGRRHFKDFWERLRRRRLLRNMAKFLRRVKQDYISAGMINPAVYLTRLSGEFREFLSLYTGINCRSLTAGEFMELSCGPALKPVYLCGLFRSWDTLRFSGQGMVMGDLYGALGEIEELIARLDRAEREKAPKPEPVSAVLVTEAG